MNIGKNPELAGVTVFKLNVWRDVFGKGTAQRQTFTLMDEV